MVVVKTWITLSGGTPGKISQNRIKLSLFFTQLKHHWENTEIYNFLDNNSYDESLIY